MGTKSFTIKSGATSMTVVGGTDAAYTENGTNVPNGMQASVAAVADFRIRPFVEFKYRPPIYNSADGTFSKAKTEIKLVHPRLSATTGKIYFDVHRHSFEISPETSGSDALDMRYRSGQMIGLATLSAFIDTGVIS